jgi:RNA polymerase sigma factor (sigma-70 family)
LEKGNPPMMVQPESDEALVSRLLPSHNNSPEDRARAWAEWHLRRGGPSVLSYIRAANNTAEAHEDILQDAMMTAYVEVERGHYEHRAGIPFTAYVKGIARNKIREARRRTRNWEPLEETLHLRAEPARELETVYDRREERRALRRGLAQLPDRRRQVLEAILGGESLSEIATRLEMTEESVRQHKHRGLRRLQQMTLLG